MTRKQVIKSLSIAAAILGTSAITQVQADEAQNLTALTDNSTVIATVGSSNEVTPELLKKRNLQYRVFKISQQVKCLQVSML